MNGATQRAAVKAPINCGGNDCTYPACDCAERPPLTIPRHRPPDFGWWRRIRCALTHRRHWRATPILAESHGSHVGAFRARCRACGREWVTHD